VRDVIDLMPETISDSPSMLSGPGEPNPGEMDKNDYKNTDIVEDVQTGSSPHHITTLVDDNHSNLAKNKELHYDKDKILARRIRQIELRFAGFKPWKEIFPMLAEEFDCDIETIHNDWTIRETWMAKAARLADVTSIMAETKITGEVAQSRFREATKSIWDEMQRHMDEEGNINWSDPVVPLLYGFLKDYLKETMNASSTQIKNMTALGIIKETPKRVQVEEKSVRININAFDVLSEEDRMRLFGALFEEKHETN